MAFILVGNTRKLNQLIYYTFTRLIITSIAISILIYLSWNFLTSEEVIWPYLISITLGIMLLGFFNCYNQYNITICNFFYVSSAKIIQSVTIAILLVLLGFTLNGSLLLMITCDIIGKLMSVIYYKYKSIISYVKFSYPNKDKRKFSKYEQLTALFSILSIQTPIILLPLLYNPTVAGYYFVIFRGVMSPVGLLSNAVLDVFKTKAKEDFELIGNCKKIFKKTIIHLSLIGSIPLLIMLLFGRDIIVLFLGEGWGEAGLYGTILAPFAYVRLISAPVGFLYQLRNRVDMQFKLYTLNCISTLFRS